MPRQARREMDKRFRKGRSRTFPSATRLYEYLEKFHNACEESNRVDGRAFIAARNAHLAGLCESNKALLSAVCRRSAQKVATLDIDATLQETQKREALYCYEGYRAYQPIWSRVSC